MGKKIYKYDFDGFGVALHFSAFTISQDVDAGKEEKQKQGAGTEAAVMHPFLLLHYPVITASVVVMRKKEVEKRLYKVKNTPITAQTGSTRVPNHLLVLTRRRVW